VDTGAKAPDNGAMKRKELITQAAFLRRIGLSRSRLKRLVAEGLPLHGSKIDHAEAVAWIESNTDPRRKENWQGNASLNDLRRQREQIRIEEGKLDLAKARGELIERDLVKKFISARARMERERGLPRLQLVSRLCSAPIRASCSRRSRARSAITCASSPARSYR
jgi:hypothetical protein